MHAPGDFPYVSALIESGGQVTLGKFGCLEIVAIARTEADIIAALVKREDESTLGFLKRIEDSLDHYFRTGSCTLDFDPICARLNLQFQ